MTTRFEPSQYKTQIGQKVLPYFPEGRPAPNLPESVLTAANPMLELARLEGHIGKLPPQFGSLSDLGRVGGMASKACKVQSTRGEVLEFLKEHGAASVIEIARSIHRNDSTVRYAARELAEEGKIRIERGLRACMICVLTEAAQ